MSQVLRGASYAFRGVGFVLLRPNLWPLLVAPFLLLVVIFVGGASAGWALVGQLIDTWGGPPAGAPGWLSFAWDLLDLALRITFVLLLGVGLSFTANLLATPFNDTLSQRIETLRLGPRDEPWSWSTFLGDLAQSVWHSVLALALWIAIMIGSALLNVFPGPGTLAAWAIEVVATALFIAREAMDGALSRRRFSFGHKLRIIRSSWPTFLGFGLMGSLVVWIPFVNLIVLPLSIAGGTLLFCDLEREGRVPPE